MKFIERFKRQLNTLVMWRIRFWWIPPKNIRSFGACKAFYDGITHYGLFLYIVHISLSNDGGIYDEVT